MNEKITTTRQLLGVFFEQRRQQMGLTRRDIADFLGLSENTVKGIETGRFSYGVDQLLKLCVALEIKPFFAPMKERETPSMSDKFLLSIDKKNNKLFILHRQYPACLIEVVQTTPVTFSIVDLYDDIENESLVLHPCLEEAKVFWRGVGNDFLTPN